MKIAKVDATENQPLAQRYGVSGYPTLKFFKDGNVTEYNGGRTEESIISWVNKKISPSSSPVENQSEIDEKVKSGVVVAYWGPNDQHFETFKAAADQVEDVVFVHNFDHATPSVVLYKNFDNKEDKFQGDLMNKEELVSFVDTYKVPLVQDFTQDSANQIFRNQKEALFLMYADKSTVSKEDEILAAFANQNQGAYVFISTQVKEDFGARLGEFVGVPVDTEPVFMASKFVNDAL